MGITSLLLVQHEEQRPGHLRIRHYGYRSRACGENIAYSSGRYGEPDNVMQRWFERRITGKHPERDFARAT